MTTTNCGVPDPWHPGRVCEQPLHHDRHGNGHYEWDTPPAPTAMWTTTSHVSPDEVSAVRPLLERAEREGWMEVNDDRHTWKRTALGESGPRSGWGGSTASLTGHSRGGGRSRRESSGEGGVRKEGRVMDRMATTTQRPDGTWRAASLDPKNHWRSNTTVETCEHRHRTHAAAFRCAQEPINDPEVLGEEGKRRLRRFRDDGSLPALMNGLFTGQLEV